VDYVTGDDEAEIGVKGLSDAVKEVRLVAKRNDASWHGPRLSNDRTTIGTTAHSTRHEGYGLQVEGPTRSLASLIRAVAVLALPAADQVEWVDSLGVGPVADELALELGDGALLAQQFVEAGWLGADNLSPLMAVDLLLKDMSGLENEALWDYPALNSSPRWAAVRKRAKDVLLAIR
jgi:hypothetical protein